MRFIDLFAGIGGFHLAFHNLGAECVFASEIDKSARKTYEKNFYALSPELFDSNSYNDDIQKIESPSDQIPDFEILCAGFPCQPFSQAGFKRGFEEIRDDRGNMFFHITSILQAKRPRAFFLENVRHILKHDEGQTFKTIEKNLTDLGYTFYYKMVKASDHGLPQHRPRIFMVGFRQDTLNMPEFHFPKQENNTMTMNDIWGGECNKTIGYTLRVGGRRSGLNDRRNWDTYLVDGEERVISSKEGLIMMGFPSNFDFPVSETQAMKQLGNSVAVNAIQATGTNIIQYLHENAHIFETPHNKEVA